MNPRVIYLRVEVKSEDLDNLLKYNIVEKQHLHIMVNYGNKVETLAVYRSDEGLLYGAVIESLPLMENQG